MSMPHTGRMLTLDVTAPSVAINELNLNFLSQHARLTPDQFINHPDCMLLLRTEADHIGQWPDLKSNREALTRLVQRLRCVPIDQDTVTAIASMPHSSDLNLTALRDALREKILTIAQSNHIGDRNDPLNNLALAVYSHIPGLPEEIHFIEHQRNPNFPLGIFHKKDGSVVTPSALHSGLLEHTTDKPPQNALQQLTSAGVSKTSALYQYWADKWNRTWGEEYSAREAAHFAEAIAENHRLLYVPPQSITKPDTGKGSRTGKSFDPSLTYEAAALESSDEEIPGFDSAEVVAQAWRLAESDPLSEDALNSLSLEITPSTTGSKSLATLYQIQPGGTKVELSHFRPHRTHGKAYEVDDANMKNMLWYLHILQQRS